MVRNIPNPPSPSSVVSPSDASTGVIIKVDPTTNRLKLSCGLVTIALSPPLVFMELSWMTDFRSCTSFRAVTNL
jgi:hypothetical protein